MKKGLDPAWLATPLLTMNDPTGIFPIEKKHTT